MVRIREYFAPIPIKISRMQSSEVIGQERLASLAVDVFGEQDPADVFHSERPFSIVSNQGAFEIRIKLPGVEKDQIDLWTKDGELIITAEGRRRNLLLPRALNGHRISKAKYADGIFTIFFTPGA